MKTNAGKDQQPRANSGRPKAYGFQLSNKDRQGQTNCRKPAVTTLPRLGS